jgi:hypothetical protein
MLALSFACGSGIPSFYALHPWDGAGSWALRCRIHEWPGSPPTRQYYRRRDRHAFLCIGRIKAHWLAYARDEGCRPRRHAVPC